MRLHLNENTAGCSPAVMDALARLGRLAAGIYPDYDEARRAVAASLDLGTDSVLLTNGLDEGILAATGAAFRDRDGRVPEGLGVTPAFDMYETLVSAFGGRMVTVPMGEAFALPVDALRKAKTGATRIVFVTNPHNPSGVTAAAEDLLALARAIAPILLFVDEAYIDFGGTTLANERVLSEMPTVIVGRTFSKSYGLGVSPAGRRFRPRAPAEPMRRIVHPYSLNAWPPRRCPRPSPTSPTATGTSTRQRNRAAGSRRCARGWAFRRGRAAPTSSSSASARRRRPSSQRLRHGASGCAIDRRRPAAMAASV